MGIVRDRILDFYTWAYFSEAVFRSIRDTEYVGHFFPLPDQNKKGPQHRDKLSTEKDVCINECEFSTVESVPK